MTVAWLVQFGVSALQAGAFLWLGLFFWTLFREGNVRKFAGWSISGQFEELGSVLRKVGQAPRRRLLSRIASGLLALGAAALVLAAVATLIRLFTQGVPA